MSSETPNAPANPQPPQAPPGFTVGESPLDFIQKSLKVADGATIPAPAPQPQPLVQTKEVPYDLFPDKKGEDARTAPDDTKTLVGADEKTQLLGSESDDEKDSPVAGDFKRLRGALKDTNKTLAETRLEKEKIEKDLEKYKSGEAFPDILQEKENKIAELSKYEKLVSLKTSKAYQDTYIKPLTGLRSKFVEYGKEYGVPEEVMNQALGLKSRDLDSFLEDHFTTIAGVELKHIIQDMKGLESSAQAAEAEPAREFERLQTMQQELEQAERVRTTQAISEKAKSAWVKALNAIQAEGRITPLIHRESDSAFNENFSTPIRTKAAQDFGRLMAELTDGGLKTISDEASIALANFVLHANASAVNFEMGSAALKHANDVEENAQRVARLMRPDIGGSGVERSSGQTAAKLPTSPMDAAEALLNNHVLANRR